MRNLVKYPDPILKKKCTKVEIFDKKLEEIVEHMFYTMYENMGVGLAAPQVGLSRQIFVINCSENRDLESELVFINPEIKKHSGKQTGKEGCLSFPGIFVERDRPNIVEVEAFDINGNKFTKTLDGLAARAVLHEHEHLSGILLNDKNYIS